MVEHKLNLKSLDLRVTYRSFDQDIVNDFYVPCLSNSILYKRAVGYFTSTALSEAARGLSGLVRNEGKMEIVASPKLTEEDVRLIEKGYELREIAHKALSNGLQQELSEADTVRVQNLTWMVANRRLDLKIAIPTSRDNRGIYHEKIGLFYDPLGNIVVFSGSLNETGSGLLSNYESIDVSVSWGEGEREKTRVKNHIEHFNKLWKGSVSGLIVMDFPDAMKKTLIEKYIPKKPENNSVANKTTNAFSGKRTLFDFQERAIEAWLNAGCKGILAMATGSGKTFTAIKAMEKCSGIKLTLVVVPSSNLVYQWENEIRREYGEAAIIRKAHGEENDWKGQIERIIEWLCVNGSKQKRVFVVATLQTACKKNFIETIGKFQGNSLGIIVDEVHRSGAPVYSRIFVIDANYRLGLSATPVREWDEEGNQAIFDYFGQVVYEYSISEAIMDNFLSKYYYYPHVVPLAYDERIAFSNVSKNIAATTSQAHLQFPRTNIMSVPQLLQYLERVAPDLSSKLRGLFLKRVDIVKMAANKYGALREIVRKYPLKRCIVYCNDLNHLEENINIIYEEGLEPIEFSSRIKPEARKRILQIFENNTDKNTLLVAVNCLDEGIDIPACDSAILVSCSRSTREFIQRRGRILRKHSTKEFSVIHDIVVLPFTSQDEAYPITPSEFGFIKEELRRVELLSRNAINSKDFNVDNLLQMYRRQMFS